MKVSKNCISLIKHYEGLAEVGDDGLIYPYKDAAGYATIGYGNRFYEEGKEVTLADPPITKEEAAILLKKTVTKVARRINPLIRATISQQQFYALVSFAYNVGAVSLEKSTLLKKLNNGAPADSIVKEFGRWIHAGGKVLKGLVRRRKSEAVLYEYGYLDF